MRIRDLAAPTRLPVLLCLLLPLLALPALPCQGAEGAPPKLIVISWDGAGDVVIDRLLSEGKLPNLARLAASGLRAEWSVTSFPSKTSVGHAAVWTGAWPDTNGVAGNRSLYPEASGHSLLENRSGFSAETLTAEPLYVTAAKAGRRVVVLSATQSYPEEPHVAVLAAAGVPPERYVSVSGFEHEIVPGRMLGATEAWGPAPPWPGVEAHAGPARELAFTVSETPFFALLYDDPEDPAIGFDTVRVRRASREAGAEEAVLKPREASFPAEVGSPGEVRGWSRPFRVDHEGLWGNTFFRLFALSPDGSTVALYRRGVSALAGAASPELIAAYLAACPGFHDDPFLRYELGGFGPTLMTGGDGTAEARTLEVVEHDADLLISGSRWAWEHLAPDVLFHYSPMIDSAGHAWLGLLDPESPRHDPALAARIQPFYDAVAHSLDRWLGTLIEMTRRPGGGTDTVIALFSDHGMHGTAWNLHINQILAEAGLLTRSAEASTDPRRGIDLAHTRALAPPGNEFFIRVNGVEWAGGIVPREDRETVLAAAEAALLSAREPGTGRPLIRRVFRPEELPGLGIGGPVGGDLYFDPAPGFYPRSELADRLITPERRPWGAGNHGFWPERRSMHAIFYAAGPGIPPGLVLPPVRHIDIAPTLARLLGIPPPSGARGQVLCWPQPLLAEVPE